MVPHKARTASSYLNQKEVILQYGRMERGLSTFWKTQVSPISRELPKCVEAMCFIFWRLFKELEETHNHLWYGFQVINVNDSQVCCVGSSSNNRLTTTQFDPSGGGWQTAALSVVIPKGAKRPFQRQLGMACWGGKVTPYLVAGRQSPGVPHDANTSACSVRAVSHTQCRAESGREVQTLT